MGEHANISVAVYWPEGGGYGIPETARDIGHAHKLAEVCVQQGYDKPGISEIHIIETVRTVTKYAP